MELSVARSETKYPIDPESALRLQAVLDKVVARDRMGPNGYMVRSLYFDSIDDADYHDKIDGLETRRKIRLRIYTPQDKTAKLELKFKRGAYQWKRSVSLDRRQADLLFHGKYSELSRSVESEFGRNLLREMEAKAYIPRTIIEYKRLAFMADVDNTRITFDSNLRASEANLDLFAVNPAYFPVYFSTILEVKYTHFLMSHLHAVLHLADRLPLSASKYCLARQISFY